MFDLPIESSRRRDVRAAAESGAVASVIHAVVITTAVFATLRADAAPRGVLVPHDLPPVAVPRPRPAPDPSPARSPVTGPVAPVVLGHQLLAIPDHVPVDIPPPDTSVRFDPRDYLGIGRPGGRWDGPSLEPPAPLLPVGEVLGTSEVEHQPQLVDGSCTPPRYPDLLRQAGIEGRVELEFVIDTAGRAEAGSVRVVRSDHGLFDAAARDAVLSCRFRAGRIGSRPVRVRVRQPVEFRLSRG